MASIKSRFSNLRVKPKLAVLIYMFITSLMIVGLFAIYLFKANQSIITVITEQRVFVENFNAGANSFYQHEISGNEEDLKSSVKYFKKAQSIAFTFSKIDSFMQAMPREEWLPLFYEIYKEGAGYDIKKVEQLGNQIKSFIKISPSKIRDIQQTAHNASTLVDKVIAKIEDYHNEDSSEKLRELQDDFGKINAISMEFSNAIYTLTNFIFWLLLISVALIIFILISSGTLLALYISHSISNPLNRLTDNFKKIAKGNLNTSVNIDNKNEIGELSKAFSEIQTGLQEIIAYSVKVANGDYSVKLKPKSADDELSVSLNKMADRLEEIKLKNEKETWLQNGLNNLEDQMRGNYSVRELSGRIITWLCQFLEAEMGAVYVYDEVLHHLELTGTYGLKVDEMKKIIKPGEEIIGGAALHNELLTLNTKDKFHKIYCATGEIVPEKIYLLPMHYQDRIQAVIELAPINEFSEIKNEFLKLVAETIKVNLGASVARYRHKELLDKTLEQAETLKLRDLELKKELAENIRIKENLIREKALLDSMLRTLPDYVYFKDNDSRFLRVSESMVPLFGAKSSADILGKSDFDFHTPADAKRYYDEEQEIIKSGKGFINEIRKGTDEYGNELWTSVTKLPMYDETGKCFGTFGISKNITQIKQLELEVKTQNEQLIANQNELQLTIDKLNKTRQELEWEKSLTDSLMDTLPDAVYFKDKNSRFIKASKSLAKLFNLKNTEELYGKSDFDFFDEKHARPAYETEQEIIRTKKPVIGLVEKDILKDGKERYVSTTKMPLFNEKGEVIGTFGISRDITQIKKLELDVRERNDKLSVQQEELQAVNDQLKQQQEELRARHEELKAQEEELRVTNEELKSQEEELRVANEELAEQTKILMESEKNLHLQQEKLNEMNKELKLASQYKSEFLANMSHELRTPLNSMLILSKLLSENKKGNLTDDQLKSVKIIYKSGKDLLELINEILDLSKIEAGKMTYNFADINTDEIKSEIVHIFKPVAENKSLNFEVIMSEGFPTVIYSDKQRLMQIVKNLLSNAFKFTASGSVKVNMGLPSPSQNFTTRGLRPENTYYIAVEDTGVGIHPEKVNDIFEAFQQADGSISRRYGGTGLGLSISKQLVQVLGGEIHVKSTEGKGSVFTVFLPLDKNMVGVSLKDVQQKKNTSQNNEAQQNNMAGMDETKLKKEPELPVLPFFIADDRHSAVVRPTILIIHNEKEKAEKLLSLCHKRNFNALVASSVTDGIILATNYPPEAIIISDGLKNPGDLKKLTENKLTSRLPLHLVSRIEDSVFDEIEELTTPGSEKFQDISKNLGNNLISDFKQILLVEDDEATREAIHLLFENKDIVLHEAKTGQQAYEMIATKPFDCVILDLGLPDFPGNELLRKLKANKVHIPNIIIHTAKELSGKELRELQNFSDSIVIKGLKSDERLMDEVELFLHEVANKAPKTKTEFTDIEDNHSFKGKKVLVVDDDIRNVFAIAQILEEREIEVFEAENGAVAIEILKNNPDIDLVLTDIMMPVMDGYETMRMIRNTPGLKNIPVIILSAKAMKEDYQKAIDNGANDYISKPVDVQRLLSLLKIWLF